MTPWSPCVIKSTRAVFTAFRKKCVERSDVHRPQTLGPRKAPASCFKTCCKSSAQAQSVRRKEVNPKRVLDFPGFSMRSSWIFGSTFRSRNCAAGLRSLQPLDSHLAHHLREFRQRFHSRGALAEPECRVWLVWGTRRGFHGAGMRVWISPLRIRIRARSHETCPYD